MLLLKKVSYPAVCWISASTVQERPAYLLWLTSKILQRNFRQYNRKILAKHNLLRQVLGSATGRQSKSNIPDGFG